MSEDACACFREKLEALRTQFLAMTREERAELYVADEMAAAFAILSGRGGEVDVYETGRSGKVIVRNARVDTYETIALVDMGWKQEPSAWVYARR